MSLILDGTTGVPVTTVTGTLPVANGGTGVTTSTGTGAVVLGTSPSISGAVMTTMASSVLTSATAQNSTSGTSIDFTGIPSWVKRITVMFNGVSTNGTTNLIIQLGVSGTPVATGYLGSSGVFIQGGTSNAVNNSTGFLLTGITTAATVFYGSQVISIMDATNNIWSMTGTLGQVGAANISVSASGGIKALSGALNMIRITTVNGTDTFDAGSINILYE